jgi:hypothetical protein
MSFLVLALAAELPTAAAAAAAERGPSAPATMLLAEYDTAGGRGAKHDIGLLAMLFGKVISSLGHDGASFPELDFRSAGRAATMVLRCLKSHYNGTCLLWNIAS